MPTTVSLPLENGHALGAGPSNSRMRIQLPVFGQWLKFAPPSMPQVRLTTGTSIPSLRWRRVNLKCRVTLVFSDWSPINRWWPSIGTSDFQFPKSGRSRPSASGRDAPLAASAAREGLRPAHFESFDHQKCVPVSCHTRRAANSSDEGQYKCQELSQEWQVGHVQPALEVRRATSRRGHSVC
jgi:hypothetical protein